MEYDYDRVLSGAQFMMKHSGSFFSLIGQAFCHADRSNAVRLYLAFKEEFESNIEQAKLYD